MKFSMEGINDCREISLALIIIFTSIKVLTLVTTGFEIWVYSFGIGVGIINILTTFLRRYKRRRNADEEDN